jgi:RNA polymerase sigma factor (TIGR02999 family)
MDSMAGNGAEKGGAPRGEMTRLLQAWSDGDAAALDQLTPLVYGELRRIAARYMTRERTDHTLQTSALINEAYLRLVDARRVQWKNRAHFFAVSAQVMRRILVDFARARRNLKRGAGAQRVSLDEAHAIAPERSADLMALDEALERLAALNPRQSRVVELRYFGGLTEPETAEVLNVSPRTARNDWSLARAWLYRELNRAR